MTIRPDDLLECVRQMNKDDRREMIRLLNECISPLYGFFDPQLGEETIKEIKELARMAQESNQLGKDQV